MFACFWQMACPERSRTGGTSLVEQNLSVAAFSICGDARVLAYRKSRDAGHPGDLLLKCRRGPPPSSEERLRGSKDVIHACKVKHSGKGRAL